MNVLDLKLLQPCQAWKFQRKRDLKPQQIPKRITQVTSHGPAFQSLLVMQRAGHSTRINEKHVKGAVSRNLAKFSH